MGTLATAQEIVDRATDELGLARVELISGLMDQVGIQSLALMNSLGEDLVRVHDWQFMEKTATFVGDGFATAFALPSDFGRIVNQTAWSVGQRRPLAGPTSPQKWGWLQMGLVSGDILYRYRILADRLEIFPTPGKDERIKFYYISKRWVLAGDGTGYNDTLVNNTDKPLFDRSLMIKGVKARLWAQKGFDTSVLAREYNDTLQAIKAQDQGAPTIYLSDRGDFSLISGRNIPDGDWRT